MKKNIQLFLCFICIVSILVACHTKKVDLEMPSNLIIQNACKNQNELSLSYLGIKYDMLNEVDINNLSGLLVNVRDYHLTDMKDEDEIKLYKYTVETSDTSYAVTIEWQQQPDDWLVSYIKWTENVSNNDYGYDINQDLIDRTLLILEALSAKDYDTVYEFTAVDFGYLASFFIENKEDLIIYLEDEFYFLDPIYKTFDIEHWSVDNITGNDAILVAVNKGLPGEFHLNVLLNEDLEMTGIYSLEMEVAKGSILFRLPVNDYSKYYDGSNYTVDFEEKNRKHITSVDRYAAHVSAFLYDGNYQMLYSMMSDKIDFSLSYEAFETYINLMLERCFVESPHMAIGTFTDFKYEYDELFFDSSNIVPITGQGPTTIGEKNNTVIQPCINLMIDIAVDDGIDSIKRDIYGIGMSYADIYQLNEPYYYSLTPEDQNEYYVPVLEGISTVLTQEENDVMRLEKARQLIKALKYKNMDELWQIESYHSGLKTKESYETFYKLQEEIIGSFNGIYVQSNGYDYLMTGQYHLEFVFLTHEGKLSKLIVTFDSHNEILSYDVMNLVRKGYYETN